MAGLTPASPTFTIIRWPAEKVTGDTISSLTRATLGGRFCLPPPSAGFSRQLKNGGRYQRQTFSTFLTIDLTPAIKMSEKLLEKLLRKWRFGDVMFLHFGSKNGKCLKAARMFIFESRRNRKMSNGVKLKVLQNGYLGLPIFFNFHPQNSKLQYFLNNCL